MVKPIKHLKLNYASFMHSQMHLQRYVTTGSCTITESKTAEHHQVA